MNNTISKQELQQIFNRSTVEITAQVAGISLHQSKAPPQGELYTVYVDFYGGSPFNLAMSAETALFIRLTQYMMQQQNVLFEDVVDFAKEYFNVVCGHIASSFYYTTKMALRFSTPSFCYGRYQPDNLQKQITLSYISDFNEAVQLTHHSPIAN